MTSQTKSFIELCISLRRQADLLDWIEEQLEAIDGYLAPRPRGPRKTGGG
jgi:hypothetical protein